MSTEWSQYRGAVLAEDDLYRLPEGAVIWKPEFAGWCLFIKDGGNYRVVDAYDRSYVGRRYSPAAVGAHSPGYVIHTPPEIGYYQSPPEPLAEAIMAGKRGSHA